MGNTVLQIDRRDILVMQTPDWNVQIIFGLRREAGAGLLYQHVKFYLNAEKELMKLMTVL